MELSRVIDKALQPIWRKLRILATRGIVKLVDSTTLLQELQVAAVGGEVLDNIEHWEAYGFTSRPHPGAEALLISLGGDRDHTVAVNVADRRFRLRGLATGEVAISTDEGDVIHFMRGNEILINSTSKINMQCDASSIVMTPAGITITAPSLDINEG